jgi:hypothetical protein
MKNCCKNSTTPFCPDCGANLTADPLRSLLAHVRKTARVERQQADCVPNSRSRTASAEKWERWVDALAEAIEVVGHSRGMSPETTEGASDASE